MVKVGDILLGIWAEGAGVYYYQPEAACLRLQKLFLYRWLRSAFYICRSVLFILVTIHFKNSIFFITLAGRMQTRP